MHITFQRDGDLTRVRRMIWAASRRQLRRVWILSGIFLVLGLAFLALGMAADGSTTFIGVLLCAIGILYALLPLVAVRRQLRRLGPLFGDVATYTLTDTDVTMENEAATHILRWSGLPAVKEASGFWLLQNRVGTTAAIIPQDCLTPQDAAEFRAFLAGRNLMPMTYRVG